MKHIRTVTILSGVNESPISGEFILSSNRDFVNRGVVVGISELYNKSTGLNATVTTVTSSRIDALGLSFKPGDFFEVSLSVAWTVQNDDGPVVEVECSICGYSFPRKELDSKWHCKDCRDKSKNSSMTMLRL